MLISRDFVFIHYPKTGGTFVTKMLEEAYAKRAERTGKRELVGMFGRDRTTLRDTFKHGTVNDVPAKHAGLPLAGCIRNPYDRLVSQFEFGWWRDHPEETAPLEEIRAAFPSFPDLGFEQWYAMQHRWWLADYASPRYDDGDGPGLQTRQFLQFYGKTPQVTASRLDPGNWDLDAVRAELHDVRFLDQDDLNGQLHAFLLDHGFVESDLEHVLASKRVFPVEGGRSTEQRWQGYFSPELKATVRRREALLFELFPHYDV